MKLKGLVWFFAITLILISIYQLSFTLVVNSYEAKMKQKAEKIVKMSHPGITGDEKDNLVARQLVRILDSTKDAKIYPVFGTTYLKCKENELNLGLDLQGGMNVTLNVDLEGVIKSLSNNPKDPQLLNALNAANAQKAKSDLDYIALFGQVFKQQNPSANLASLFAGAGKSVKITDSDQQVLDQLETISKSAINQTYKILSNRVDQFGVAQTSTNLEENKGIITVELPGVQDATRVRKLLQASAHLQFWEVYNIGEISKNIEDADKALAQYLNGTKPDSTKSINDTTANKTDSSKLAANDHPLANVIHFIGPQQDKTGKQQYYAQIANVDEKDTAKVNEYLNLDVVKNNFPANLKFLYGLEEKDEKSGHRYFELYAIKTLPGTDKAKLEGEGVEDASADYDEHGRPAIKMQMTPTGTRTWAKMTADNVNRPIAIVLDDVVYSAPNVIGAIDGGNSEISGNFSVQEAQDLANILKIGKIDAPAKIVSEQIVGPTLGKEAVQGGAKAFAISFLVIFILMLIYYNTAGWVANIALILNLLFTIGVLSALGASLTAAGIAGLVLTIGMAVDTNVIIFERIKEELVRGKNYQQAVHDGYRRSLAPVIDAHVTTFLTAAILFYFGLGPVKGFATTQMLGISLSLFCGILLSRLVTDVWMSKKRHFEYFTTFSKKIFKHANFKFIEYRKYAYMLSVVVLILGVSSFFNGFKQGVEFKGGRSYTVEFSQDVKNDDVRNSLRDAFEGDYPEIKTVGDNRHLNITTSYKIGEENADSAVLTRLYQGLKSKLPPTLTYQQFAKNNIQGSQVVQPVISKDLRNGAIKATIFALIAIILYIFIRFRDWRYSMGTIISLLHDVFVALAVFSFFKNIVPFPLEIDQHFIAAILTVIGFSMNDTVIVFDRIREYSRHMKGADKPTIINRAVNDTLSRTIMTSVTVFLTLLILFIFGGEVTRGFAFAMLIGVITGTYSSIFVASPILVDFAKDRPLGEADHATEKLKKADAAKLAKAK
ncbi:protein translocase subunit SecDF [Ginsengibacter hankyongi]|uniref:Multifunctional fusion protein n=1 Tax=Ginsengibacter hankyongi TaxID=2607284 RepID=A0A5J5IJH7_9BACT|nr:protein translocase subunit SecDF [Ginsengibacter hankyongi]KAA9040658.1 protein translocase subunit SecDF [Ginsengibacter hankyongi]